MAQTRFKTRYNSATNLIDANSYNVTDLFQKGILKLPFYDNTVTSNLLTDLRIALLSSSEASESVFTTNLFFDSKTIGTLSEMDSNSKYAYLSGGYKFENLGFDAAYATLSADDTTINIPGLTINNQRVFAVIYFEDTSAITASTDVMSDTYKQNSHILTTVENVKDNQARTRFAFKQSVIIDAIAAGAYETSAGSGVNTYGILAMNNVVGPGFSNVNRNGDLDT